MKFILQLLSLVISPAPIECMRYQLAYSRLHLLRAENERENADAKVRLLVSRISRLEQQYKAEAKAIAEDLAESESALGIL